MTVMFPAFGRELFDLRRSGQRPAQPVYVVGDWGLARACHARERFALMAELVEEGPHGLVVARRFDFSMLRDLDVVLIPAGMQWRGIIAPQVRMVRPRRLFDGFASYFPGMQDAAEKISGVMAAVEGERVAA